MKLSPRTIQMVLTTVVCGAIFYTSFRHIVAVAMHYGNTMDVAIMYPVCIDAVILISALTLIQPKGVNKQAKMWATVGRVIGFVFTLYANMLHSGWENTDAVLVNLIPGIMLIVAVELLIYGFKGTAATRRK
jgi:drug/metabolite transporter (DMT)-like permease